MNDIEPKLLVRSFSDDLKEQVASGAPASPLERIVAAGVLQQETNLLDLSTPQDEALLKAAFKRLLETWHEFKESLPPGTNIDSASFADVLEAVAQLGRRWEEKRSSGILGKAGKCLRNVCKKLKGNTALLNVIPDSSHYTSIVAAALNIVINATVNHEAVAAFFSEAVEQILGDVAECHTTLRLHPTARMKTLLVDFYCKVLVFLRLVMTWYQKRAFKRGLLALNDDIVNDFRKPLEAITSCRQSLSTCLTHHQAAQANRQQVQLDQILQVLQVDNSRDFFDSCVIDISARQAAREETERRLLALDDVVQQRQTAFLGQIKNMFDNVQLSLQGTAEQELQQWAVRSRTPSPGGVLRQEIVETLNLARFYSQSRLNHTETTGIVTFPAPAMSDLQMWISSQDSALLSIAGPPLRSEDMASVAAAVTALAEGSKLPVIRYFCCLESGPSPQLEELTAMLCALADQCFDLWPTHVDSAVPVSPSADMDVSTALELLTKSVQYLPAQVYCIVDGIQLLQFSETDEWLQCLVDVLRTAMASRTGRMKVLLTTAGRCNVLLGGLNRDELVLVDGNRISWIPGQFPAA